MKKPVLVILLTLGMLISFIAIGLVMLFATGTIRDMDEARALLTGESPGPSSAAIESGDISQQQDAAILFQRQKQELEQELQKLSLTKGSLEQLKGVLLGEIDSLRQEGKAWDGDLSGLRKQALEKIKGIFNQMDVAPAAAIMDHLDDETVLTLIPMLEDRHAARVLAALTDDQRKADLTRKLAHGHSR